MRGAGLVARLVFAFGALAVLFLGACSSSSDPNQKPNVLLITLDTTRADALGCYQGDATRTPHLDALAAEGTRFDLGVATASLTPVSHASILTGLDNARHGVRVMCAPNGARLSENIPTLATILSAAGHETLAATSAFPVSSTFGLTRGFARVDELDGAWETAAAGHSTWNQAQLQRRADHTTDRALEMLAAARGPFCAWVHYWDPHDGSPDPPDEFVGAEFPRDAAGRLVPTRRLYAAKVRFVDREIGRLLDGLRRDGRYENTIVVVVGDHGEGLGDHGFNSHRILYQEQIRVPLIVRVPGGARVHDVPAVVRTTDVLPTILDFAGVPVPGGLSGRSMRSLIEGSADEPRVAFADEINGYDLNVLSLTTRPHDDFGYAVIDLPWKYVYRPLHPDRHELFDLVRDPRESENRAGHEPAVERALAKRLAAHGGFVTSPFRASGHGPEVERVSRQLARLGYVSATSSATDARFAFACPDHGRTPDGAARCPTCGGGLLPVRAD